MNKVIFWKRPDGSVCRESIAYLPQRVLVTPEQFADAVFPAGTPRSVVESTPYITAFHAPLDYVRVDDGTEEMLSADVAYTYRAAEAVYRDETEDEVFERWLRTAKQREADKKAAYAQAVAEGRFPLPEDGLEFAGVCARADDLPPQHEAFFNALEWDDIGKKPKVHMGKAREIHKAKLREMRAPKLAALDVEYQRASERGDTTAKATIGKQKQALRDVTADPRIAAAQTLDELKAVIPEALE